MSRFRDSTSIILAWLSSPDPSPSDPSSTTTAPPLLRFSGGGRGATETHSGAGAHSREGLEAWGSGSARDSSGLTISPLETSRPCESTAGTTWSEASPSMVASWDSTTSTQASPLGPSAEQTDWIRTTIWKATLLDASSNAWNPNSDPKAPCKPDSVEAFAIDALQRSKSCCLRKLRRDQQYIACLNKSQIIWEVAIDQIM